MVGFGGCVVVWYCLAVSDSISDSLSVNDSVLCVLLGRGVVRYGVLLVPVVLFGFGVVIVERWRESVSESDCSMSSSASLYVRASCISSLGESYESCSRTLYLVSGGLVCVVGGGGSRPVMYSLH
jgi:hypothetical protein